MSRKRNRQPRKGGQTKSKHTSNNGHSVSHANNNEFDAVTDRTASLASKTHFLGTNDRGVQTDKLSPPSGLVQESKYDYPKILTIIATTLAVLGPIVGFIYYIVKIEANINSTNQRVESLKTRTSENLESLDKRLNVVESDTRKLRDYSIRSEERIKNFHYSENHKNEQGNRK